MFVFSIREVIKSFYFFKIKKMKPYEYRLYHLRKAGMTIGENCWIFSGDDSYISETVYKENLI